MIIDLVEPHETWMSVVKLLIRTSSLFKAEHQPQYDGLGKPEAVEVWVQSRKDFQVSTMHRARKDAYDAVSISR